MSRSPAPPALWECIRHRRKQLRLSQAEAARRAQRARSTWIEWETGTLPDEANYACIEDVCQWAPGSVADVLAGLPPSTLGPGIASVTPLRPDVLPPDDEFVKELRAMCATWDLPEGALGSLVAAYWAEKAGGDQRQRRDPGAARRQADS